MSFLSAPFATARELAWRASLNTLGDADVGIVDATDYGAVGDGVTDDSVAIQRAANALPSTGGMLYLPQRPAAYLIHTGITLKGNTWLCGAGVGATTIKLANTSPAVIMVANQTNGDSNIKVSDLTLDGNKANNGAGTNQGLVLTQVSQATVVNVEVMNVNGNEGICLSGNGVNTTRGGYINRVYVHDCTLHGLTVTYACRQVVINGARVVACGTVGNSTWPAVFLDASECVADNIIADSNISAGIHIHNVFGCTYRGLVATRNGTHGIYVEEMTSSLGGDWRAQNNSMRTANTYDDAHFVNTDGADPAYGVTKDILVNGMLLGPNANFGTSQTRYGLYIEDNVNSNIHLANVLYGGTPSTGTIRNPSVAGTLVVD